MTDFPESEFAHSFYATYEDDDAPDDAPEGFTTNPHSGPYSVRNGPIYHRDATADELAARPDLAPFVRGFRARTRHCNGAGIVHGGCLMSFADGVLGRSAWDAAQGPSLTIRMNSDILHMARPGDWVEGRGKVVRKTNSVVFVEAEITVEGRMIVSANGIFKIMRRRGWRKAQK